MEALEGEPVIKCKLRSLSSGQGKRACNRKHLRCQFCAAVKRHGVQEEQLYCMYGDSTVQWVPHEKLSRFDHVVGLRVLKLHRQKVSSRRSVCCEVMKVASSKEIAQVAVEHHRA